MAFNGISTIDKPVVETVKPIVETKVKTVVKKVTNPCKKCKRTFDKKSNICKSCVEYKGALKWQSVK